MLLLAMVLALAGCATPMDPRKDREFQSRASITDRPAVRPTRSISSFSDSLMCMDHMLRDAQLPTTLITSKQIPDYSSRVAVAAKDMVITALSQMSRLSNAFRYVDYEVDIARQDTVQNMTTILLNNNQMQLQRPALYLSGSISFVDQNVISNRFDTGLSGPRVDLGFSQSRNATIIGLEMHLGDFRTRTLIPGLDSANEVIVGGGGQGLDLAGRIGTYGVQFNIGRDYTQGSGGAVRTLVDLATIELVGKWARVPYWQCLTLEQNHPDFQRQLRDWFDEGSPAVRTQLVARSLTSQGYLAPGPTPVPDDSVPLRQALARFQADKGMVVTGVVDFPTYERALRNFVSLSADGTLARIGWESTHAEPVATAPEPPATAAASETSGGASTVAAAGMTQALQYGAAPIERTISLQIENVLLDRTAFDVGEQIFLSATVSRASYLQCYLADATGTVIRLLPNKANPTGWVSANQAVRIPDWMSPNPGFIMDAASPGTEGVACFASDEDSMPKLPQELRGPPLKPLKNFHALERVNEVFAAALGTQGYTGNAVYWNVVPRRAVPPSPAQPPVRK
ncbi:MAG: DUF4384 domain-containing protein [Gammaproteobacteria bacterium]|nr:DUF4384 domain-containing protein [Gammaproteobacteria bacterium]MBU1506417.1 DUF4384 domain-containing protein [Gammaproteobacteria bacterium]MBU2119148.1 DUF4384 domain-containing protein [Gammaproteobacteria bacterium]MBU2169633.1 DUF4384 domain-containing protein [Gammaproteobacteria bacterium]MBU2201338.1 DUF4384 domain-containing protein [Gammaproteobacteria bacterium]